MPEAEERSPRACTAGWSARLVALAETELAAGGAADLPALRQELRALRDGARDAPTAASGETSAARAGGIGAIDEVLRHLEEVDHAT